MNKDRPHTNGKAFLIQGHASTGKTFLLSILRNNAEDHGILTEISTTTVIADSLYKGGRTLYSLPGIGKKKRTAVSFMHRFPGKVKTLSGLTS